MNQKPLIEAQKSIFFKEPTTSFWCILWFRKYWFMILILLLRRGLTSEAPDLSKHKQLTGFVLFPDPKPQP